MVWLFGTILSFMLGAPLYLPWILARIGKYKRWYLAYFAPPFMWHRAIFAFPSATGFVIIPFLRLLPDDPDLRLGIWGYVGLAGVIIGFLMMLWTPRWAKPKWQQYLEDNYPYSEIRRTFVPVWREMDRRQWNRLMDSEEGIDELVRLARKGLREKPLDARQFRVKQMRTLELWQPKIGERVVWNRHSLEGGWHSGLEATVEQVMGNRVQIAFVENGQQRTRVVHTKYIVPIRAVVWQSK